MDIFREAILELLEMDAPPGAPGLATMILAVLVMTIAKKSVTTTMMVIAIVKMKTMMLMSRVMVLMTAVAMSMFVTIV